MHYLKALPVMVLAMLFAAQAYAQPDETQTVNITVEAVNEMAVSGDANITINSATAGSAPSAAGDNTTSYNFTTNESGKIITAQLAAPLTAGLTLEIEMADPGTGDSAGSVVLTDASAQSVVTGITPVASEGNQITYTAEADVNVAPDTYSPVVEFTITDS